MRTPPNERLNADIAEPLPSGVSGSERRCILTGESFAREDLIRLAIAPDGEVLPDVHAKAPGRGAWISPDRAALEAAMASGHLRKGLMRAFKGGPPGVSLHWSSDLPDRIHSALARGLLDRLGLELRSGNIVLGAAKIEDHARTGRIALLLHASDAREDGRRKLDQAWRVGMEIEGSGARGTVLPLDREALSVALGRENVVHLGVSGHGGPGKSSRDAGERTRLAANRLIRFLGADPP